MTDQDDPRIKKEVEEFHSHLNECSQCRNNPFNLCFVGEELLRKSILENNLQPFGSMEVEG